ncbi:hypothetical protein [Rhizobium mesosinicum]|uniref:Uncharacterized protein n=1 Tax=Rhizobium mesosinicum TaxID=335017 RepID=A0ABS7GMG7_9HYPH|nr:hypothetical protein [Rhizobium mesosinicum]MBW9051165.1 hypothetical protein [Rhizobium mesosinicum]
MPNLYHPDRFPVIKTFESADPSVSGRLQVLHDVATRFAQAGGSIYDLNDLSDSAADLADITITDLGITDPAFYVHVGKEGGTRVGRSDLDFVDGIYFVRQPYHGREGYFLTVVTATERKGAQTPEDAARIACGWIDAELTVDDGLIDLGLWGDPAIVDAPNRFDIECLVGRALTKVRRLMPEVSMSSAPAIN